MRPLRAAAAAFSMFSRIPMPAIPWDRETLRYVLCAFPLVGAAVGLACWGWWAVCGLFSVPPLLRAGGLCALPVLLTGGIHLDGFCDTWDALSSHAPPERKQEILKDPDIGAFAAIRLCLYFVLTFALWAVLPAFSPWVILPGFCLSRALSGLAVAVFPLARDTGLAHTFAEAADRKRTARFLGLLSAGLILVMSLAEPGAWGCLPAAASLLVFAYYRRMAEREFGGLSGDLAGWFLQTAELWILAALEAGALLGGMLS